MSPSRRVETEVEGRTLSLSNLDKVLFPASGFTKGELIDYYARVAPVLLPHVRDRPLTMHRYVEGVDGPSFYEKHAPAHAPTWVRTVKVPSTASGSSASVDYAVMGDLPTLVWAANLASIEFHVPLWHVGRGRKLPGPPDHVVFDLDPGPNTSIVECCVVAARVRDALVAHGLDSYPKTSGSKGLQVYAPLPGRPTWEKSRELAHDLALALTHELPDLVVANMRKDLRRDKVLIDWSQNHPAKSTVAAYSVRARAEPTVSTPVSWDEVTACGDRGEADVLRFTTADVLARVAEFGDLLAAVS